MKQEPLDVDTLIEPRFDVDGPNQVRVSDITYVWARRGFMYMAVVIDTRTRAEWWGGSWAITCARSLL